MSIDAAFGLGALFFDLNAVHEKRGIRVAEQPLSDLFAHMREEIDELEAAEYPEYIGELADIMALCASFAARKQISPGALGKVMMMKMLMRLKVPDDERG